MQEFRFVMATVATIAIRLPDGTVHEHPGTTTPMEIALGSARAWPKPSWRLKSTGASSTPIARSQKLLAKPLRQLSPADFQRPRSPRCAASLSHRARDGARRSCASTKASRWRSVRRLRPVFYYDFQTDKKISEDDFPAIEAEIAKIIQQAEPFERFNADRDEALKPAATSNKTSRSRISTRVLAGEQSLSFYRQGEFVDLCRGPAYPERRFHQSDQAAECPGAYWKGDAAGPQLQRVYGTAFFDPKELEAHLAQVEEARRRDHRVLGKKLGLFAIQNEVVPGFACGCLVVPACVVCWKTSCATNCLRRGYQPVNSPHFGRVELYETSGHFPYYRDSQFPPLFGHDAAARCSMAGAVVWKPGR